MFKIAFAIIILNCFNFLWNKDTQKCLFGILLHAYIDIILTHADHYPDTNAFSAKINVIPFKLNSGCKRNFYNFKKFLCYSMSELFQKLQTDANKISTFKRWNYRVMTMHRRCIIYNEKKKF